MSQKIYKSAMGRIVDLGALILENEHVRAVGNMNVNARGDILDSANRVVEPKNKQLQKHYSRQVSNTTTEIPTAGGVPSKKKQKAAKVKVEKQLDKIPEILEIPEIESMEELAALEETMPDIVAEPAPVQESAPAVPRGGLAAAIAKSQAVKQELLKTPRQLAQSKPGVNKI
jgi:hypothetical protein